MASQERRSESGSAHLERNEGTHLPPSARGTVGGQAVGRRQETLGPSDQAQEDSHQALLVRSGQAPGPDQDPERRILKVRCIRLRVGVTEVRYDHS